MRLEERARSLATHRHQGGCPPPSGRSGKAGACPALAAPSRAAPTGSGSRMLTLGSGPREGRAGQGRGHRRPSPCPGGSRLQEGAGTQQEPRASPGQGGRPASSSPCLCLRSSPLSVSVQSVSLPPGRGGGLGAGPSARPGQLPLLSCGSGGCERHAGGQAPWAWGPRGRRGHSSGPCCSWAAGQDGS